MKTRLLISTALSSAAIAAASSASAETACERLVEVKIPHVTITSAKVVEDVFVEPPRSDRDQRRHAVPSFCQVQGVSRPVPGSEIGFEVWLPQQRWSGRLNMFGNGAFNSNYYYTLMAGKLRDGSVVVATDTGHKGGDLKFGIERPEAIVDWGHRAVHETVVAAKALVAARYGRGPAFSYFSGCSTGGHQALQSIQRYPEDFDGVISGAPGNNRTNLTLSFLWQFINNHEPNDNRAQIIPNYKLRVVNRAAMADCDGLDGLVDGVITDPRACRFDLEKLRCKASDRPECLTDKQIKAMRAIYAGPKDVRNGRQIYPGYQFGQEGAMDWPDQDHPGWSHYWYNPEKPTEPQRATLLRDWTFKDPNWNWWTFNWGSDIDTVDRVMAPILNATDPDLSRYRRRGGKLIMFMGWDDPVGAPMEAVNYYESVVDLAKGRDRDAKLSDTQRFARLYMVSGMAHCAGGDGATAFSTLTRDSVPPVDDARHDMGRALEAWVEKGRAPEELIATRYASDEGAPKPIEFQRPVCVYPKQPRYKGGDPNAATSFVCAAPKS